MNKQQADLYLKITAVVLVVVALGLLWYNFSGNQAGAFVRATTGISGGGVTQGGTLNLGDADSQTTIIALLQRILRILSMLQQQSTSSTAALGGGPSGPTCPDGYAIQLNSFNCSIFDTALPPPTWSQVSDNVCNMSDGGACIDNIDPGEAHCCQRNTAGGSVCPSGYAIQLNSFNCSVFGPTWFQVDYTVCSQNEGGVCSDDIDVNVAHCCQSTATGNCVNPCNPLDEIYVMNPDTGTYQCMIESQWKALGYSCDQDGNGICTPECESLYNIYMGGISGCNNEVGLNAYQACVTNASLPDAIGSCVCDVNLLTESVQSNGCSGAEEGGSATCGFGTCVVNSGGTLQTRSCNWEPTEF